MARPVPRDHVIVLFGATGDLAARKLLPGFFELAVAGLMPRDFRVIGSAPGATTDDDFRSHVHDVSSGSARSRRRARRGTRSSAG